MTKLELFFLIKTQACFQLSNLQEILSITGFQKTLALRFPLIGNLGRSMVNQILYILASKPM